MKIEFLPPEEAAQRIHDSLLEHGAAHDGHAFVEQVSGLSVGTATLFRWIKSPEKNGPSLQLFWWAFSAPQRIPSIEYAHWFVSEMGTRKFRGLLKGTLVLEPQKVLRWTKRVPQRRQWELQAAVALAMALQEEAGGC